MNRTAAKEEENYEIGEVKNADNLDTPRSVVKRGTDCNMSGVRFQQKIKK
jgi:hypothetical protein